MREIRLELLDDSHLDDVRDLVADPDVLHYTRIPEPPPDDFAESWIAAYESARKDGTREGFAAITGDGEFVGIGLAPWSSTSRTVPRSAWPSAADTYERE